MIGCVLLLYFFVIVPSQRLNLRVYAKEPFGDMIFLRHALAPGTNDPEGFNLTMCSTQRNLDSEGRQQASDIGSSIATAFQAAGKASLALAKG